jgi:hypothetical protein
MLLTQTPELVDNSPPSGAHARRVMPREAAVGAPQRFIHDYKTTDFGEKRKFRRLPWFVAGLGIPLICVAFILPQTENSLVAVPTAESFAEASLIDTDVATMRVRPGDSLDRLFRRNDLHLADLAELMQLDVAKKHLRLVKPGDEIEVRHAEGRILQFDKPISLSEALSISSTNRSASVKH